MLSYSHSFQLCRLFVSAIRSDKNGNAAKHEDNLCAAFDIVKGEYYERSCFKDIK